MPISDLLAQITGETQSPAPLSTSVQKRKADGDLRRTNDKLARRDQPIATSSKAVTQIRKLSSVPPPVANSKPTAPKNTSSKISPSTPSNGAGPITAPAVEPAKVPKKGSYAEILARAKAAQANLGPVGKIQHKPVKSLSKRERQELKEQGLQSYRVSKKSPRAGARKNGRGEWNGVRQANKKVSKAAALPEKKIKKAALATTGYTGTARPNPVAAKSSKPALSSKATSGDSQRPASSSRRDMYASEDEDTEEEQEEDGYYSDASSDMEAAVFEVDEEEERAARIARKEDEAALKEETLHQREKDRRRRLAALAKVRR